MALHTVVGEGQARKEFLNSLSGPKSRSAVYGYRVIPWPFTLLIYSYVCCLLALILFNSC